MKTFPILLIWFIFSFQTLAQPPIITASRQDISQTFKAAKLEFARFEKTHGHFITTPNGRMHYVTWGNPSAVPLIWSHGSFTNSMEMLPFADSLVKAGYYVIAIDYYGHGQTPIPDHEVSLYHVADDVKSILDQLKIRKAVVGGWSRGGIISTAFYDAYPERVMGLILEDGGSVSINTGYHQMDSSQLNNRIEELFRIPLPDTSYSSELEAFASIIDTSYQASQFELLAWIQRNKEGRWAISPGTLELFNMKTAAQFRDNILYPTRVPLFAESMSMIEPKIVYRNLSVPMLIIDPISADDLFPYEAGNAALQKQHPTFIEHKIYPDTGHNAHFQRPEQFVKDVCEFIKRVR